MKGPRSRWPWSWHRKGLSVLTKQGQDGPQDGQEEASFPVIGAIFHMAVTVAHGGPDYCQLLPVAVVRQGKVDIVRILLQEFLQGQSDSISCRG